MMFDQAYAKELRNCKLYYVVKPGDTLAAIASSIGMFPARKSAVKIAKTNGIDNSNIINTGDKLCIDENIVNTGSINLDCYKLNGQKKICMDKDTFEAFISSKDLSKKNAKCNSLHTIKRGETLSILASKAGMSPPYESALKIAEANGIKNPRQVEVGDKICMDKNFLKSDEKGLKCVKTKKGRKVCIDKNTLKNIKRDSLELKETEPEKEKEPEKKKTDDQPQPEILSVVYQAPEQQDKVNTKINAKDIVEQREPVVQKETKLPVVDKKGPEKIQEKPQEKIQEKAEDKKAQEDVDPSIGIQFAPFLSYSAIQAVDVSNGANGYILSKPDFGSEFRIMQIWGDYFTSEMFLLAERRSYFTNSGRTFTQHGGNMLNFGAGLGFRPFKRLEVKLRAIYGDEFYFRAPDMSSLAIDCSRALKVDMALYFDIVSSKYAATGLGGGIRIIKSGYIDALDTTNYYSDMGYGYFATFYMKHKFTHLMLEESFTYENIEKDTNLFKQLHVAAYIKGSIILLF